MPKSRQKLVRPVSSHILSTDIRISEYRVKRSEARGPSVHSIIYRNENIIQDIFKRFPRRICFVRRADSHADLLIFAKHIFIYMAYRAISRIYRLF